MVAHLEYAIGVLCLGGVAAVAGYTIIDTVANYWDAMVAAMCGHPIPSSVGASETAHQVSAHRESSTRCERDTNPSHYDFSDHFSSSTPALIRSPGEVSNGAEAVGRTSLRRCPITQTNSISVIDNSVGHTAEMAA